MCALPKNVHAEQGVAMMQQWWFASNVWKAWKPASANKAFAIVFWTTKIFEDNGQTVGQGMAMQEKARQGMSKKGASGRATQVEE
jgi:hypothetical protein